MIKNRDHNNQTSTQYFVLKISTLILKHYVPLPVDASLVLCTAALLPFQATHERETAAAKSSQTTDTVFKSY